MVINLTGDLTVYSIIFYYSGLSYRDYDKVHLSVGKSATKHLTGLFSFFTMYFVYDLHINKNNNNGRITGHNVKICLQTKTKILPTALFPEIKYKCIKRAKLKAIIKMYDRCGSFS